MRSHRILYVAGSAPSLATMAPVLARLRHRFATGRHVLVTAERDHDQALNEALARELSVPEPTFALGVGSGGYAAQTAHVLERLERVIDLEHPDLVIVAGAVDSTLAATLAAVKTGVPIAYVGSGLRSFDRSMPEEINRVVADEFASLLFADSDVAVENLVSQGIDPDRIHLVGNTTIDLVVALDKSFRALGVARELGLVPGSYLMVALPASAFASRGVLWEVLDRLKALGQRLPVIFAVEDRLRRFVDGYPASHAMQMVEAPDYLSRLSLAADAAGVLTDDAAMQVETTCLSVPCFTLRTATERPRTVVHAPSTVMHGTNTLLDDHEQILEIAALLGTPPTSAGMPPLWDGKASERIADVLERELAADPRPTRGLTGLGAATDYQLGRRRALGTFGT